MFDAFKAMSAISGLMKNKDALQAAGERIKQRLGEMRAEGSAGSGAVRVTVDGRMSVLQVKLDPALVQAAFVNPSASVADLAGSLIAEATNQAISRAQVMAREELSREAKALGLPELPGLDKLMGA
jgi:DNA-binding protein YbaB